jgi:hypothetical protein
MFDQVLQLLRADKAGSFFRSAVAVTALMASHNFERTEQLVLKPLLSPLYTCLNENGKFFIIFSP